MLTGLPEAVYRLIAALDLDISLEDPTSVGRIDMSVRFTQPIHLIGVEFSKASCNVVGGGVAGQILASCPNHDCASI
jgi:hypothetical protein